jgi:hypothetical protein
VFIPVRLPQNAFDLTRSTRAVTPAFAKATPPSDVLSGPTATPFFPPALRDIGGELDRLLAGLAPGVQKRSEAKLGLQAGSLPRASVLASTAKINGAATSFEKVALAFGSSTSMAAVSGTYKGTGAAAAATALTVSIDSSAIVGDTSSPLAFHVSDQTGATLFSYAGSIKAGQAISLGPDIGLALTFGQGSLVAAQAGRTGVSRTRATVVDDGARFGDADLNARPRFDNGGSVTEGSFSINGTTIAVKADDSIKSILQRITDQRPDIIASYDKDKQAVTLATRDATRQPIVLADDTSGFLEATKLAGATTKPGYVTPDQELLADSKRFAAVQAGSFRVGSTTVTVDPRNDTLASVLARMSGTGEAGGVTAYYDDVTDEVVLRGGEQATTVDDDSSGFLAALGFPPGRELAARETLTLDPATAARLEQGAADREAKLVERTFAGPAFASAPADERQQGAVGAASASARETAAGSARKAKAAYGRELDDARDKKSTDGPDPSPAPWSKTVPTRAGVGDAAGADGSIVT